MTPQQATNFLAQIEKLCKDHDAWSNINLKKEPDLKHIKIEISAKITKTEEIKQ